MSFKACMFGSLFVLAFGAHARIAVEEKPSQRTPSATVAEIKAMMAHPDWKNLDYLAELELKYNSLDAASTAQLADAYFAFKQHFSPLQQRRTEIMNADSDHWFGVGFSIIFTLATITFFLEKQNELMKNYHATQRTNNPLPLNAAPNFKNLVFGSAPGFSDILFGSLVGGAIIGLVGGAVTKAAGVCINLLAKPVRLYLLEQEEQKLEASYRQISEEKTA